MITDPEGVESRPAVEGRHVCMNVCMDVTSSSKLSRRSADTQLDCRLSTPSCDMVVRAFPPIRLNGAGLEICFKTETDGTSGGGVDGFKGWLGQEGGGGEG